MVNSTEVIEAEKNKLDFRGRNNRECLIEENRRRRNCAVACPVSCWMEPGTALCMGSGGRLESAPSKEDVCLTAFPFILTGYLFAKSRIQCNGFHYGIFIQSILLPHSSFHTPSTPWEATPNIYCLSNCMSHVFPCPLLPFLNHLLFLLDPYLVV